MWWQKECICWAVMGLLGLDIVYTAPFRVLDMTWVLPLMYGMMYGVFFLKELLDNAKDVGYVLLNYCEIKCVCFILNQGSQAGH